MALTKTPICEFDLSAPNFSLKGVDNKIWTLEDCKGKNGLLVMFICNHCPYVQAIINRLTEDVVELQSNQIGCVAIMANDTTDYPEDSYENMQKISRDLGFSFPYLVDETQQIAKQYGAVCTPDFFGFDSNLKLQYRGRLDSATNNPRTEKDKRELVDSMLEIVKTGIGPKQQTPSIGCSIKWK